MRWPWMTFGAALLFIGAIFSEAEEPRSHIRSFAGAFLAAEDHNFFIESEVAIPVGHVSPVTLWFWHRESTPFLELESPNQAQTELVFQRDELRLDVSVMPWLSTRAVAGYHTAHLLDRSGLSSAYVFGGGVTVASPNDERWRAALSAGTFADRRAVREDWWHEVELGWRLWTQGDWVYLGSTNTPFIWLSATMVSVNDGDRMRALYRVGPEFRLRTAHGNEGTFGLGWFRNDQNPFYGEEENGLLFGFDVVSELGSERVLDARVHRQPGWLPMVWGGYEAGYGGDRRTTRFEINTELLDVPVAEQLVTLVVWYEIRQEHRTDDFDYVTYAVTLGAQTPVGLESPLSRNEPLVAGFDFLHRSDHAMNPSAGRVALVGEPTSVGLLIPNGSLDVLRVRLQTPCWNLPYRDPGMYEARTAWLHQFDWRITAGYTLDNTRDRTRFSAQLGLNWDIFTWNGFVGYARGMISAGDETPDWVAEAGVRRPLGKVFVRVERYGVERNIGDGPTVTAGVGVHL
ncbi:MAG: hypothetical protein N3A53_04025 [Verrucomicrobiae bacterium]|nr:hypothetical protein [Verrucomicrobiae bacterium]